MFSLVDRANPMRAVDLFVRSPIDFELLWSRAAVMSLEATTVRVAHIDDLITLKRQAGRPQDLLDVEQLELIHERRASGGLGGPPRGTAGVGPVCHASPASRLAGGGAGDGASCRGAAPGGTHASFGREK